MLYLYLNLTSRIYLDIQLLGYRKPQAGLRGAIILEAPAPRRHNPCAPARTLGTASTSPGGRRGRRWAHSGRGRAPRAPSRRGACASARWPGSPGGVGDRSGADREARAPPVLVVVYAAGAQRCLPARPLQQVLSAPAAAPRVLDRAAAVGNGMNKVLPGLYTGNFRVSSTLTDGARLLLARPRFEQQRTKFS